MPTPCKLNPKTKFSSLLVILSNSASVSDGILSLQMQNIVLEPACIMSKISDRVSWLSASTALLILGVSSILMPDQISAWIQNTQMVFVNLC